MLTNKEKKFLKKEAHHLKPIFQIGKNGINPELLEQVADALNKRELIKVTILQNSEAEIETVAQEIAKSIHADVVQTIGRVMVLYKPAKESKNQNISQELRAITKD